MSRKKAALRAVPSHEDYDVVPASKDGILRASDFRMRAARHLWHPYLPLGKITVFDGDPGRGKSQITVDLAARIITGRAMPVMDLTRSRAEARRLRKRRGVVMICAEDDWADTVLPRMHVALRAVSPGIEDSEVDAALGRVAVVGMKETQDGEVLPLEFPKDTKRIRSAITAVDAALVVVDPIMAFFGEGTNTGNDASVRKALSPFKDLAAESGAAFVLIRHLNKQTDLKAEYRGGGSHGGFIGLARSSWLVGEHPDESGVFVFVHAKANITLRGQSISYVIVGDVAGDENGEVIDTSRIEWGEPVDMDADTLMRGHDARKDAPVREACWGEMRTLLEEQDPRPADDMLGLLKKAGYSAPTVRAAKKHYGVKSVRLRQNGKTAGWVWTLDGAADDDEAGADT